MIFTNSKSVSIVMIMMLVSGNIYGMYKKKRQLEEAIKGVKSVSAEEMREYLSDDNITTIKIEKCLRVYQCLNDLKQVGNESDDTKACACELIRIKLFAMYQPLFRSIKIEFLPYTLSQERQNWVDAILDNYSVLNGKIPESQARPIDPEIIKQIKQEETTIALQVWDTLSYEEREPITVNAIVARMFLQDEIADLYNHRLVVDANSLQENKRSFADVTRQNSNSYQRTARQVIAGDVFNSTKKFIDLKNAGTYK